MMPSNQGRLFRWLCHLLKYFLLSLVGFTIACILSITLLNAALPPLVGLLPFIGQFAILISCLLALAVVLESARH